MIDFSRLLITFTTYLWLDKQDRQNSTKIFFFTIWKCELKIEWDKIVLGIEPGSLVLAQWWAARFIFMAIWGSSWRDFTCESREPLLLLLWDTRTLRDTQNNLVERL